MSEQERRIAELEAQTAQMGEVIGQMAHDHAEQGRKIARLRRENLEVRELARDACTVLRGFYVPEWFDETVLAERMRKLGIEVDDGQDVRRVP